MRLAFLMLVSGLLASPVLAQAPTKWECSFTTASDYKGDASTDRDPAAFRTTPTKIELVFLETDKQAYVMGNSGASEVGVFRTNRGGVQFVERTGSGVLQITAIDTFGNAAHSRHTIGFDGILMAAQHYGKCRKL